MEFLGGGDLMHHMMTVINIMFMIKIMIMGVPKILDVDSHQICWSGVDITMVKHLVPNPEFSFSKFSEQTFWGAKSPILHCGDCPWSPLPSQQGEGFSDFKI